MNYSIYRGRPSCPIRLGFKGKFGRKFQRNHNYKFYENVYMFRSGSFLNAKLSDEPTGLKKVINNSIKALKNLKEELSVNIRENASVAATSIISVLLVLNLYSGEIKNNNVYTTTETTIENKINELNTMKTTLIKSVNNNTYRLKRR